MATVTVVGRNVVPELPMERPTRVRPDWACEILSPSNRRYDRGRKRRLYATVGVHPHDAARFPAEAVTSYYVIGYYSKTSDTSKRRRAIVVKVTQKGVPLTVLRGHGGEVRHDRPLTPKGPIATVCAPPVVVFAPPALITTMLPQVAQR